MERTSDGGDYETHITVSLNEEKDIQALRDWASKRGLKCTHILLERGATVSQPMLTKWGKGRLPHQLEIASTISKELITAGFLVTRIKVEATTESPDVPQSASEVLTSLPNQYFEHHIKLLLQPDAVTTAIAIVVEKHGAHVSRNALKTLQDGCQERFVTQRCAFVGREEARHQLEALLQDITLLGYPIVDIEEEFVLYDSNLALDAGWILLGER